LCAFFNSLKNRDGNGHILPACPQAKSR
jgi:hypothetical protein